MKLSELKLSYLRRTISVDINGETQEINIFNVDGEKRQEIINSIIVKKESEVEDSVIVEELYNDIFFECTDLELDEDVYEVVNNPTQTMLLVMNEIMEIIHEIQCEVLISKIHDMNQVEQLAYAQIVANKADNITTILEKLKEIDAKSKDNIKDDK